ncbi:hypothetical protein [Dysgonomonas sp. 520]|uniref:hypothetical protein n=1 Tax=Dysgonomonas sp. 520 TaxID=2302931 RepID=UPI0013D684ED|nr:hypothetical protein [Dysgonomonas sp. 520]NDW10558.1 hypothetical protein [Dysgonomonas sp. 520]
MEKIVAILTRKGTLSNGIQRDTAVNVFSLENNEVVGVENISLNDASENYFSLLMKIKNVSLVYADSVSNNLRKLLTEIGISTKCGDELSGDKFIGQFIFE